MLYHLNQVSAGIIEDRNHDIAHVCGGVKKLPCVEEVGRIPP